PARDVPSPRWLPDRLRGCTRGVRSAAPAQGLASLSHSRDGRFDGGASFATAAPDSCRGRAGERLGAGDREMVQPPARLRVSDPRVADARYFRAHGDVAALRLHRAPAGSVGAGALWERTEGSHGGGAEARGRTRSVRPL